MRRILAGAAIVGVAALGVAGGSTYALWSDTVQAAGAVNAAVDYFAAGRPGTPVASVNGGAVTFTFGLAEATMLATNGSVAIPIKVDGYAQGVKAMTYDVSLPANYGSNTMFSRATVKFAKVASVAACTASAPAATTLTGVQIDTSADRTDKVPVTHYWCLVASLPAPNTYSNTGTVTGTSAGGVTVSANKKWTVGVVNPSNAAGEPDYTITFSPHLV